MRKLKPSCEEETAYPVIYLFVVVASMGGMASHHRGIRLPLSTDVAIAVVDCLGGSQSQH